MSTPGIISLHSFNPKTVQVKSSSLDKDELHIFGKLFVFNARSAGFSRVIGRIPTIVADVHLGNMCTSYLSTRQMYPRLACSTFDHGPIVKWLVTETSDSFIFYNNQKHTNDKFGR